MVLNLKSNASIQYNSVNGDRRVEEINRNTSNNESSASCTDIPTDDTSDVSKIGEKEKGRGRLDSRRSSNHKKDIFPQVVPNS
jgi:hypothetical protein